jgi:hypothetical protein
MAGASVRRFDLQHPSILEIVDEEIQQLVGAFSVGARQPYDVASDGRFLINVALESAPAPITMLMNWNPEAKK